MKIAVDLNGGDHAPRAAIKGIELAVKLGFAELKEIVALGTAGAINRTFKEKKLGDLFCGECSEMIGMGDDPKTIQSKKFSSIAQGTKMVKQGQTDALVSAGNTAAMVIWGALNLKRIKPGLTPAIAVPIPNESGPCLLLDAGAIHEARPNDLLNCARMGSIYAREIWRIEHPIVRLLNIGREIGKGNETLKEAGKLLAWANGEETVNFQGNIEGDRIFTDQVNVIVCPGEIGNNTVKVAEGAVKLIQSKLGWLWPIMSFFYAHHKRTDYKDVGGGILLGVNGVEIIAHGKSQPLAIANAIRRAKMEVEANIIDKIRQEIT